MYQGLIVAGMVIGSGLYALWVLCPQGPRSRLAERLLALHHPVWLRGTLQAAALRSGSCACDGCDRVVGTKGQAAKPAYQPLVFQPRKRSVLRPEANQ